MKWLGVAVLILLPLLAIELAVMGEYEMAVLTTVIAAFTIYPVLRMWTVKTPWTVKNFNSESPPSPKLSK